MRVSMAGLRVPRWLVAILWPTLLFLVYAGLPAGLADVGPRHGWRTGRPGPLNLLGLVLFGPGLLSLVWITYRHLASSPKRIEVPQPAPEYLLTDGIYRWSRHPMYVAGITTWVGWAIYYGGWRSWPERSCSLQPSPSWPCRTRNVRFRPASARRTPATEHRFRAGMGCPGRHDVGAAAPNKGVT